MLSAIQRELRSRIADAVKQERCNQVSYHTEWLGYLPFGQYHWMQCNGQDIDLVWDDEWSSDDLVALKDVGFLVETAAECDPNDETARTILYQVELNSPNWSWHLLLRVLRLRRT